MIVKHKIQKNIKIFFISIIFNIKEITLLQGRKQPMNILSIIANWNINRVMRQNLIF